MRDSKLYVVEVLFFVLDVCKVFEEVGIGVLICYVVDL